MVEPVSLYEVEAKDGIVSITIRHRPTVDEMLTALQRVSASDQSELRLWHFTEGLDWTPDELRQVAETTRSLEPQPTRVAIVSATDLSYGLLRLFQAHRETESGADIQVFRDLASARAFLLAPTEAAKRTAPSAGVTSDD